MAKSSNNSERESISGESAASCSGVSLTAAILTHPTVGHQEDSADDINTNTATVGPGAGAAAGAGIVSQQAGGEEGERGRGKGRKRAPCENGEGGEEEEGERGRRSGVLPSRSGRRRTRNSPSKKRESEWQ